MTAADSRVVGETPFWHLKHRPPRVYSAPVDAWWILWQRRADPLDTLRRTLPRGRPRLSRQERPRVSRIWGNRVPVRVAAGTPACARQTGRKATGSLTGTCG